MSDPVIKLPQSSAPIVGVVIAKLVGFRHEQALVQLPDDPAILLVNHSCAAQLRQADIGSEVALSFIGGDPAQPMLLGKVIAPARFSSATIHQRELSFESEQAITFRCGKSSLTLRRDGKIEIRGEHVLSVASSINQVRGGVISLN